MEELRMEVERTVNQLFLGGVRVRWSAVIAGWAVALATQLVLTLLGLAVGAWSIDLSDAEPVGAVPIGAGIWTGLSLLVAAFVGGYITARMSGSLLRSDGLYHGVVVWGVNWVVFAWLTTTAMATLLGGVFSAFGTTLQSLGQGATTAVSEASAKLSGVDISMDELRRQAESILAATGKQELQPGELQKDAERVESASKGGQSPQQLTDSTLQELRRKLMALDRDAAINIMTTKMGMSEPQARQFVQSTTGLIEPLKRTAEQVKQRSAEAGEQALDRMGTIAMWLAALAIITLGLSIAGGMIGTPKISDVDVGAEQYRDRVEIRRAS
jgi:F0F1-type ATP synthase membrane subunit b/b'